MKKSKAGNDVITITNKDWKGKRSFKTAPAGKYRFRVSAKSNIKPNARGDGNVLELISTLTSMHNGKRTEYKGINIYDNLAPHVGWKIAQVLRAIGIRKPPKRMTLQELLKLLKKFSGEFRAVVGMSRYNAVTRNTIVQYLPLDTTDEEENDDIEDDDDLDDAEDEDENDDEDDGEDDDEDGDEDEEDEDEDGEDDDDDDEDDEDDEDDDDEDDVPAHKNKKQTSSKRRRR